MSLHAKLLTMIGLMLAMHSCQHVSKETVDDSMYFRVAQQRAGSKLYWQVYHQALDSLQFFAANKLSAYKDITDTSWQLDSLVCFNQQRTKCVMAFGVQYGQDVSNGLNYFYGVKVNQQWLFFRGPHLYLPSEAYGYPPKSALPFAELHEQAMVHIFRAYLHKDASGQWRINDHFFADMTDENRNAAGFGPCFECQSFEEYALFRARANWISSFVPFTKQQVTYHYNPDSATLTLAIPLRKPPIPYVRPYQIAITYRQATQAFTGADYDQPFTRLDSTQQRYQAVLGPLNPHTDYLIRVMIHYSHFTRSEGTVHVELPYHSP